MVEHINNKDSIINKDNDLLIKLIEKNKKAIKLHNSSNYVKNFIESINFKKGDIVSISHFNDRLYIVLEVINDNNINIKDILHDTVLNVSFKTIEKLDTINFDLSKPKQLMVLVDSGIIDCNKVLQAYDMSNSKYQHSYLTFLNLIQKRDFLEHGALNIKIGLGWC